jgi:hypothetical protein
LGNVGIIALQNSSAVDAAGQGIAFASQIDTIIMVKSEIIMLAISNKAPGTPEPFPQLNFMLGNAKMKSIIIFFV